MNKADVSLNIMKDTIGSNVIVTSMAMGLAMVVSDVGSIRDYVDESNGLFCLTSKDFIIAFIPLRG
ncbi:glycosyltransferase family 4 protein [Bacteroides fragilis]|nr:glycosyltransferase family 4 protein [Bacteroides fragilis]